METLFIGTNVIFLPEVDSTNSYAINLLKNVNLPEGTIVHTNNQTSGRGQRGNVWNTLPGSNLTVSLILKPSFLSIKNQFVLYQIAALACYDVMAEMLDSSQFDIKIKWPNDIMIDNKKIAGILIENVVMNNTISYSVVGIGINIKQGEFDLKINATSLELLNHKNYEVQSILKKLCYYFEKYYLLLKNNKLETINQKYLEHFYGKGEWLKFEINQQLCEMQVKGISNSGLLLLSDKNGKEKEFDIKEAKWIL